MVSANPTGPLHVAHGRNGAYGDAVARLFDLAGHAGRARVLLQRLGRADGAFPRLGRRGPSRRGAAGGRVPRRVRRRARRAEGRSGAADAEGDRGDARALSHPLRQLPAAERARAPPARSCCRGSTPTRRRERSGPGRRRTATTRIAFCCARGTGRRPIGRPTSRISSTSSNAASTARSTSSAPTTTAPATGTRRSPACSATTPSASRCSSTRWST